MASQAGELDWEFHQILGRSNVSRIINFYFFINCHLMKKQNCRVKNPQQPRLYGA